MACSEGCGDDAATDDDGAGPGSGATSSSSTTASGGNAGSAGIGGGGPECPAPEPMQPNEMTTMTGVTAMAIDQTGQPANQVNAAICGINVCGDITNSPASGALMVNGNGLDFVAARFSTGYNGRGYAKLSADIPMAPTYDFGTIRVIRIPQLNTGVALTPGQDATNSGVTLGVPADAVVEFDMLNLPDAADHKFVAAVVDITGFADEIPALDPSLNLQVIVALGAIDTHICPAASLTFQNTVVGWMAGAEVEIYIHGTKTFQHYAPYGGWAKVADAAVSSDGMTVSTVAGQGVEVLGTYGARLKP
jgi:hypothetical protein